METWSNPISSSEYFNEPWEFGEVPRSFLVHTSIINKWEKIMNKMFTNSDWEMCEHILQLGKKCEMHLIIVLRTTKDQFIFLRDTIQNSQVSFSWEENPTLFVDVEMFYVLKKFIKDYNLEKYILKIQEKLGHSIYGGHSIKVVWFNQRVAKLDIIHKFKNYCYWQDKTFMATLFMRFGFPWQQSYFLQKIHLNDDFILTLSIFLRHIATLNYANDLDILDLLSLRLAFSDVRDPFKSDYLNYEIDFMIKRVLAKITENNHLSIHKYLVSKNSKPSGLLMSYLQYEFQNFFDTLDAVDVASKLLRLNGTIKLKEEIDVLNVLKERFNVHYRIDGKGFDKMSLSLFVSLIESKNVFAIDVDTNYRWINNMPMFGHNRIIPGYKKIVINLRGQNTYNFIECFAAELKTITFDNVKFIFNMEKCNLNDYRIFDHLTVSKININDIKIDLNMLENLKQCDITPRKFLYGCSLENTCLNWQLLNNLEKLSAVEIDEDDGTWLSMFEFILKEIRKSNTNEFQFNSKPTFQIGQRGFVHRRINLNITKFIIDEQNSKLEICNVRTNEIVDLYCKMYNVSQDEKPDYEFYE